MNVPGLLPWFQEWSQEVYCSLVELHALVHKDPWEEIWKVCPKQPTSDLQTLARRFALINEQLP